MDKMIWSGLSGCGGEEGDEGHLFGREGWNVREGGGRRER